MATRGDSVEPASAVDDRLDFNYPFMFAWQPPAEVWNVAVGTTSP